MIGFIGLFDTARDYNLQFTITLTHTHTLVSTVTSSLAIVGSGFQRQTFSFLRVPELLPASATSFSQQRRTKTEPQKSSISPTHRPSNLAQLNWLTELTPH
jgi:hypothetical protein